MKSKRSILAVSDSEPATQRPDALTPEELEFAQAMDDYKRKHNPFPTWSEVLNVVKALGYVKK